MGSPSRPTARRPRRPGAGSAAALGILLSLASVPEAPAQDLLERFRRTTQAQAAFARGEAHYDARRYEAAREEFTRALELDPGHDDALALLGWSQYHLAHYRAAIITFKTAIRRRPDWAGLYDGLGWSRLRLRRYHLASEAFRAALDRNPDHLDALVGVAFAQFELGRYQAALPLLDQAFRRLDPLLGAEPPELAGVRAKLAWTLYYLERYREALALFEKGIAADPGWHGLHNGAGWCHLKLGDVARARTAFERALSLQPNYQDALEGLRRARG